MGFQNLFRSDGIGTAGAQSRLLIEHDLCANAFGVCSQVKTGVDFLDRAGKRCNGDEPASARSRSYLAPSMLWRRTPAMDGQTICEAEAFDFFFLLLPLMN
jgi:hypothetical protein